MATRSAISRNAYWLSRHPTAYPTPKQKLLTENKTLLLRPQGWILLNHINMAANEWIPIRIALQTQEISIRAIPAPIFRAAMRTIPKLKKIEESGIIAGAIAVVTTQETISTEKTQILLNAIQKYANGRVIPLAGYIDQTVIGPNQLKEYANLPPIEELQAKLLGILERPAQQLAQIIQSPAQNVAMLLVQRAQDLQRQNPEAEIAAE